MSTTTSPHRNPGPEDIGETVRHLAGGLPNRVVVKCWPDGAVTLATPGGRPGTYDAADWAVVDAPAPAAVRPVRRRQMAADVALLAD